MSLISLDIVERADVFSGAIGERLSEAPEKPAGGAPEMSDRDGS